MHVYSKMGDTKLSITTFNTMTLSITTFNIMTLSITTFNTMTLSINDSALQCSALC
jgi:hypothetical protein